MPARLRQRLYALQQRLALTTPEATALLCVAGLLFIGLTVQQFQAPAAPPVEPGAYAALDAAVAARTAAPADSIDTAPAPTAQPEAAPVVAAAGPPRPTRRVAPGPVRMNLNTASARLLERLPRIGPALSERIVAYREAHGPFARPEDVVNVKGIGAKTFEKLEPYLFVE